MVPYRIIESPRRIYFLIHAEGMKCTVTNTLTGIRYDKCTEFLPGGSHRWLKRNRKRISYPLVGPKPIDLEHPERKTNIVIISSLKSQIQHNTLTCNRGGILSRVMDLRNAHVLLPRLTKRTKDENIWCIGHLNCIPRLQKKSKKVILWVKVCPHIGKADTKSLGMNNLGMTHLLPSLP